jgi:hypothetical protein
MNTRDQLNFLISKIEDLQTAVLHNCSNCVLNVPSAVVKTLRVDETGCIWFTIFRPKQSLAEFDRRFPVELNYYQKAKPFFLNIQGMARLVIDPEEINELPSAISNEIQPDRVLICVKITSANYHQRKADHPKHPLSQLKAYVFSFFESHNQYINLDGPGYLA